MNSTVRPSLKFVAVTALVAALLASQAVAAPVAHAACLVVKGEKVICVDPP